MKGKSKKRGRTGKIILLMILIGIGLSISFFFRQEIFTPLKPWLEKSGILEEKKEVLLYFSDLEGEYLIGEKREISKRDKVEEEAKQMIIELIKGPREKLIPTLPPRTKLLTLQLDEKGVAKVNFDKTFSKDHPGGSSAEIMTVYSVVNSLTLNFPQIKRVQILIEGERGKTIAGHFSLEQPVSSKPNLIRKVGKKWW